MLRKSISNKKRVPEKLYKKIIDLMPICCVDAVLKADNKLYLFKRSYQPAKGRWWFIGGRILKGERLKDAVIRKVKEEVGIDVKVLKMIGLYEIFFTTSFFDAKKGTHAIGVCFLVEPKHKDFKLKLNEEYMGYKMIAKIEKSLHPYIKAVLRDSKAI